MLALGRVKVEELIPVCLGWSRAYALRIHVAVASLIIRD